MWPYFHEYHMRFRLVSKSTPSVSILCLKDPQMRDDTIYPKLLLTIGVVRWNKLSGFWQLKDEKNSPLTINNYLLKYSGVTMIFTICMEIVSLFVEFKRQTNEVFGWCSFSMSLIFFESEAFSVEALVLGEISFLILLSSVLISDIFSLLILKIL